MKFKVNPLKNHYYKNIAYNSPYKTDYGHTFYICEETGDELMSVVSWCIPNTEERHNFLTHEEVHQFIEDFLI